MKLWTTFIICLLFSFSLIAQDKPCGFKTSCECQEHESSIQEEYNHSHLIFHGAITEIKTLSISEVITPSSVVAIENESSDNGTCAKSVLVNKEVLRITFSVQRVFKGKTTQKEIYILTPNHVESCGKLDFEKHEEYIIYATKNTTADIYFLWTLDNDYFELKPEYQYWTNVCKRSNKSKSAELKALEKLVSEQ